MPRGRGQILAPWPNRIEDGWYDFAGTGYQLPVNELETGTAIHGLARWASWVRLDGAPSRVRLGCLLNARPGYPFPLELSVTWELGPAGLRVTHHARNIGARPCPFGLGVHPYLHAPTGAVDDMILTVPASRVEEVDCRDVPVRTVAVQDTPFDFRRGQRIGALAIDRSYSELAATSDGRVAIDLASGDERTRLWFQPPFRHVQIFTGDSLPEGRRRRALAVEPLTCPANAFRTGRGRHHAAAGWCVRGRLGHRARAVSTLGFGLGGLADDAEPIPKGVAAERCRPRPLFTILDLDEASFGLHFPKYAIEIVNVKIDVHRRPVPLVSAHVRAIGRGLRASRLLVHADRQVVCVEDRHRRERPCDFDESEYGFIKS